MTNVDDRHAIWYSGSAAWLNMAGVDPFAIHHDKHVYGIIALPICTELWKKILICRIVHLHCYFFTLGESQFVVCTIEYMAQNVMGLESLFISLILFLKCAIVLWWLSLAGGSLWGSNYLPKPLSLVCIIIAISARMNIKGTNVSFGALC